MSANPEIAEKTMSLTLADFHRGVRDLAPGIAIENGQTEVTVPQDDARVCIRYEALDEETLGGLLTLPRARVTIRFDGLGDTRREEFLARFERAFHRGGG